MTLLLFLALARMTKSTWKSAFVAAVFAVHPLHVESVAWAAERKDVLSGLFWMLSLYAYARYAERPGSRARYAVLLLCVALGLLSKPMVVTLPLALLLLDYWPLGRLRRSPGRRLPDRAAWRRPLLEKLPMLVLAAGVGAVTLALQRTGAMGHLDALTFDPDLSAVWLIETAYRIQQGCLATTRRRRKTNETASLHFDTQVIKRLYFLVALEVGLA